MFETVVLLQNHPDPPVMFAQEQYGTLVTSMSNTGGRSGRRAWSADWTADRLRPQTFEQIRGCWTQCAFAKNSTSERTEEETKFTNNLEYKLELQVEYGSYRRKE